VLSYCWADKKAGRGGRVREGREKESFVPDRESACPYHLPSFAIAIQQGKKRRGKKEQGEKGEWFSTTGHHLSLLFSTHGFPPAPGKKRRGGKGEKTKRRGRGEKKKSRGNQNYFTLSLFLILLLLSIPGSSGGKERVKKGGGESYMGGGREGEGRKKSGSNWPMTMEAGQLLLYSFAPSFIRFSARTKIFDTKRRGGGERKEAKKRGEGKENNIGSLPDMTSSLHLFRSAFTTSLSSTSSKKLS